MKIVIIGDGKVGMILTEFLTNEGFDVVVIDKNPDIVEHVVNNFDVMGVCGNGASYDILLEAGVNKADLVIAVTSGDELNILACLTAKKLGALHTIARVRNPEYSKQLVYMRDDLGLSMIVNPEFEAARDIFRIIRSPETISREYFSKGRAELAELKVDVGSMLDGITLFDLHSRLKVRVLVCAVQRGDDVFIPRGNFTLKADDKIHVTGSPTSLNNFYKQLNIVKDKIKKVMIIGGGKVTYYLASQLEAFGVDIKIIENNRERCEELSHILKKANIIHGDGTNQDLLLEEGIQHADACVALTDIDEENIVISMFASSLNVSKVITKINKGAYVKILESIGLESIISPKIIAANSIVSYVRAMNNASGSNQVKTLYKIVNNKVEAIEFSVNENKLFDGVAIKDLPLKENLLIACIVRNGKVIIPSGNDVVENNDNVVVVSTNQHLCELNDILK